MTGSRPSRPARNRRQSSPEVVARLQRSRRKALDRRAAMRERERTVTAAVRDFISAWHAIELIEQRRDAEIEDLKRRIEKVVAHADVEIGGHRDAQATAASVIHGEGHSDVDIADLLEVSVKEARRLIAAARKRDVPVGTDADAPQRPQNEES